MTLAEFLAVQEQLFAAFGWFVRWWLILFAVGGVFASMVVSVLVSARWVIDKS